MSKHFNFSIMIINHIVNHINGLKIHTDCDVELHWMQAHLSKYERNREQRHLDIDESFSVPTVIRPLWRWHPPVQQQYQISGNQNKILLFFTISSDFLEYKNSDMKCKLVFKYKLIQTIFLYLTRHMNNWFIECFNLYVEN